MQKGCDAAYDCKILDLKCSITCEFCNGKSCEYMSKMLLDSEEDEEETPLTIKLRY